MEDPPQFVIVVCCLGSSAFNNAFNDVHCCLCHNLFQLYVGWTVDVARNVCCVHGVVGTGQGQGELQEHLATMVAFVPFHGQRCLQ